MSLYALNHKRDSIEVFSKLLHVIHDIQLQNRILSSRMNKVRYDIAFHKPGQWQWSFQKKWQSCTNSSERKWIIRGEREPDGEECPIYASMDPQAGPLLVLHGRNYLTHCRLNKQGSSPESKIQGANVGPTWGRQAPGGPHVGHMTLAIWVRINRIQLLTYAIISRMTRKYIWL